MKPKSILRSFLLGCSSLLAASSLHAADGTWTADADGNWSDTGNWDSGIVADGADFTALFDNVITADRTVTLDTARTIGNITFSDTTHHLTISGANTLTLDTTSGTPTIDVVDEELIIAGVVAGSDGVSKTGAGTVRFNGANTYTGGTTVTAGRITAGNNDALGVDAVTITGNSTIDAGYGVYPLMPNALQVNTGVTLIPSHRIIW